TRRTRGLLLALGGGGLALAATAGWTWLQGQALGQVQHPLAIVAADDVPLYQGNGPSYLQPEELPTPSRGMGARVRLDRGDWLQVQLPGGELGWLRRDRVLLDLP